MGSSQQRRSRSARWHNDCARRQERAPVSSWHQTSSLPGPAHCRQKDVERKECPVFSEQSLLAQSSRIQFRWTTEGDLDAVLRLEQDAENRSFIIPWKREQHREACANPELAHLIIETRRASRMIGFLLLAGRQGAHHSVECRR